MQMKDNCNYSLQMHTINLRERVVKRFSLVLLSVFLLGGVLFAQNVSLDRAIEYISLEITDTLANGTIIAVLNIRSESSRLSEYVIDELMRCLSRSDRLTVVERDESYRETVRQEMDYQLSGEVSDESAQSIGKHLGAQSIVSGSFEDMGKYYRIRIRVIAVETMAVQAMPSQSVRKSRDVLSLMGENISDPRRLNSIGVSAGTSFATPAIVGTIHGTIAPLPVRNMFFEAGVDFGLLYTGDYQIEGYFSLLSFARVGYFMPLSEKIGIYAGMGGGYMFARYIVTDEPFDAHIPFADVTVGANIFGFINVSYTLRTDFKGISNKVSVGYVYRFK